MKKASSKRKEDFLERSMEAQMQDTKEREKYFFQSEVYLKRS